MNRKWNEQKRFHRETTFIWCCILVWFSFRWTWIFACVWVWVWHQKVIPSDARHIALETVTVNGSRTKKIDWKLDAYKLKLNNGNIVVVSTFWCSEFNAYFISFSFSFSPYLSQAIAEKMILFSFFLPCSSRLHCFIKNYRQWWWRWR